MADIISGVGNLAITIPAVGQGVITGLIAADAPLEGAKMRLYTNDITPSRTNVVGDFVQADYTGYVAGGITITWHAVTSDDAGNAETIGSNCIFAATDDTVSNVTYGYYVVDAAAAYLWGERFEAPQIFQAAGDSVVIVPRFLATTS